MATNRDKGRCGLHIGSGGSAYLDNVHIEGFDSPIHIEPGGSVTARNLSFGKELKPVSQSRRSTGWTGKEQFDPKQHALRADDPFHGPKLLLREGAEKHISEFDKLATMFFANQPYVPLAEIDAETGDKVYKLKATADPPTRMRYVSYSAINDLRNALDQAVCASSAIISGATAENAYFPFAESPADLEGMLRSKRYVDIPDTLKPFLRSLQPYPTNNTREGGDDLLRSLGKIANPNKHQIPLALFARNLEGAYALRNVTSTKLIDVRNPYWDSTKNELIIARTAPDGTFEYSLEMPLYIAFGNVGVLTGYPVSAFLRELAAKVDSIIRGLEAETARIMSGA